MTATLLGLHSWEGGRSDDGHRNYKARWLAVTSDVNDGPESVSSVAGLPAPGNAWLFGNDSDLYARCTPELSITPTLTGEINDLWWIDQTYTTKGLDQTKNRDPNNPLTWAPEISGSFVKYTKEAAKDKDDKAIKSSSHERFKGTQVEIDACRHQVSIKIFLATLPLSTYVEYINTVNTTSMWGLTARMVKLSNVAWKVTFYGASYASKYYEVTYEFDIDFDTFDRKILDEGTRVLKPGGTATNPKHFIPYTIKGQPGNILLDGSGNALTDGDLPTFKEFKLYKEKNLLLLGIPSSL